MKLIIDIWNNRRYFKDNRQLFDKFFDFHFALYAGVLINIALGRYYLRIHVKTNERI